MNAMASAWALHLLLGLALVASPQSRSWSRAQKLYDQLEYGAVIKIVESLLPFPDKMPHTQKLDLMSIYGSSLVVVGRRIDAEKAFRLAIRIKPDFDLPKDTAHKILSVFRKVQVEEQAIRTQTRRLERARQIKEIEIRGEQAKQARGGKPIAFSYVVTDPQGMVSRVNVRYRKRPSEDFSSLALSRDSAGTWTGEIPAGWTANKKGIVVSYFVATEDRNAQTLKTLGSNKTPFTILVAPGELKSTPVYKAAWFWVLIGVAVVATGTAGYLATKDNVPDTTFGKVPAFD